MLTAVFGAAVARSQVTIPAPVMGTGIDAGTEAPLSEPAEGQTGSPTDLPDAPEAVRYPDAVPLPAPAGTPEAQIDADYKKWAGGHFTLDGHVRITYEGHTLMADHAEYDETTGDATLEGHVTVTGGENDEEIHASHGTMNTHTQTGRFYDVWGTVGLRATGLERTDQVYANGNPFRFTGRMVVKTGPQEYEIYGGTVTSCALPRPDWQLSAGLFSVDQKEARAKNSVFHLMGLPILYLPYVTHPRQSESRQSGIMIPVIGDSSDKGITLGEQVYWAISRSTDLTVGTIYYSMRGWSQSARFQHKGLGEDFVRAHYTQLEDRGYTPTGGNYINQSGTDVLLSGRHDFRGDRDSASAAQDVPVEQDRVAADVEYLSSFAYREAFTDNFNQAVSSDVISTAYGTHERNGMAVSLEADRYQGEKRIAQFTSAGFQPEEQVHLFHAPSLEFETVDKALGRTRLEWNVDSSIAGLKRVTPNSSTTGLTARVDVRPELALPFRIGELQVRPSVAVRETFYSKSRVEGSRPPVQLNEPLNRSDTEIEVQVRPPVLERTFDSGWARRWLKHDVKHTIEPDITYRYRTGIGNYASVLRFDPVDVVSDTNELEYGVTQRLYVRHGHDAPCDARPAVASANEVLGPTDADAQGMSEEGDMNDPQQSSSPEGPGSASPQTAVTAPAKSTCGAREWISWRVAQKYFFNPSFGGAVSSGPRTVLSSTLDFTGIAFLTRPRNVSPVISRLRVRTSSKTDVEWDFNYDFCAAADSGPGAVEAPTGACYHRLSSTNVLVDVHQGNAFGGVSYAWLNAPERSYVEGVVSSIAKFEQMRVLLGWGKPTRAGLSVGANAGLDLNLGTVQYGAVQASYNWNCCGFSVEYRKYELGSARNESVERFNFTLANIGSAGNLRRAQSVF